MLWYPHFSEEDLIKSLKETRDIHLGPRGVWPSWIASSPSQLLADKKFVVLGSGCRPEIRLLAKHAEVVAIVDDFLVKTGEKVFGIPVIGSDDWIDRVRNDKSVVSVNLAPGIKGYQHFSRLALQWGLPVLEPLQFLKLFSASGIDKGGELSRFFMYGENFYSRTIENLDALIERRNNLGDAYSRLAWLSILAYRMTLNPFYLDTCAVGMQADKFGYNSYSMNRQFFKFSDDEVYVDAGAFNGDTIATFLHAVQGKFKHIHSFEPSSENNRQIRQLVARLQDTYVWPLFPRITLHEKGLWDRETTLLFNPSQILDMSGAGGIVNPQAAHIIEAEFVNHVYDKAAEEAASISVPVTTIDDATDRSATFIKFEIEGSELKALHGARETIARNRPKMAVSIYHKPEDLETLMDFVVETGLKYKMGYRQHNPFLPDAAVLYCY